MHIDDGQMRAYLDQEFEPETTRQIQAHLQTCTRCQARADQALAQSQYTRAKMATLEPEKPQAYQSPAVRRARLIQRRSATTKEYAKMSDKWYQRIPRPVWAAGIIVVILAIALMFAPVRAIANSFLGLFRVQQIQVVQVNPGNLPQQLGSSSQFESMFSQDVQFQDNGEAQEVASLADANRLAGISARLPQGVEGQPILAVQPGGAANLTVNVEHVRALLAEIGRSDIQIPDGLDGARVDVQVPAGILARYGECQVNTDKAHLQGGDPDVESLPRLGNCTTLVQMPSPTISAPPGLDIQMIGEAYLQVMGMSREEAAQFARNVDWTSTFVIPIPRYGADYQEVAVDGVTGTLILKTAQGAPQYLLMWVKDGIVYALTGPGNAETALQVTGSMK